MTADKNPADNPLMYVGGDEPRPVEVESSAAQPPEVFWCKAVGGYLKHARLNNAFVALCGFRPHSKHTSGFGSRGSWAPGGWTLKQCPRCELLAIGAVT